jgi:3-hydroxyisobutyrate dehydrogenase-like beta-hydroxyacid dehydrogenase
MMVETVGFIGLGNMGSALATNLVEIGFAVVAHDVAGPSRLPAGAQFVGTLGEIATSAELVVLSLPDGPASEQVARELAGRVHTIVDTSTIGVRTAERITDLLAHRGTGYLDAPVSGGPAGARARTLMVMYAGTDSVCDDAEPVLAGLSDRRQRVGDRPGLGQALKLANNFLAATALAAASEAVAFGLSVGLTMETMLDVLGRASGQSNAISDKFPNHVLTGRYAAGFANTLMAKDVDLYLQGVRERGGPAEIGLVTAALWERFASAEPGADFTRVYPFVAEN